MSLHNFQEIVYSRHRHLQEHDAIRMNRLRAHVEAYAENGSRRILELGCGNGLLLERMCGKNECHGVDISKKALESARGRGYQTHRHDLEIGKLPFPDEYFDIVVFGEVIEHVVNTELFINEINRVLRFGGMLVMSFPNINQPISFLMSILLDMPPRYSARIYSPHVRDLTLKLVRRLLMIKGFRLVHAEGTYVYPLRNKLSQFVARKVPRLGEKLVVAAKKETTPRLLSEVIWDVRAFIRD